VQDGAEGGPVGGGAVDVQPPEVAVELLRQLDLNDELGNELSGSGEVLGSDCC